MYRQTFNAIAEALAKQSHTMPYTAYRTLVHDIADALSKTNDRFDKNRFLSVCRCG